MRADNYATWITVYLSQFDAPQHCTGRCFSAVKKMAEHFPELIKVSGHVETNWGRRGHWWLVDPDGNVVDPTAAQFPAIFAYEPWNDGDEVQAGKCMNCGSEIWVPCTREEMESAEGPKRRSICSDICHKEFAASLGYERAE